MTAMFATLLVLALVSPSVASAQNCDGDRSPGGNSEVDQYTETVPDACGNRPSGGNAGNPDAVPPATAAELSELGPDGAAALELAQANAPKGGGAERGDSGSGLDEASSDLGSAPGSVLDALGGSSGDDDGGMGLLLPLLIVAVALAGAAYVLRRRRSTD
jgi:hypothetical protein